MAINIDRENLVTYKLRIIKMGKEEFKNERLRLLRLINGDAFFSLKHWPKEMRILFYKKPHSDRETSLMIFFLIGKIFFIIATFFLYCLKINVTCIRVIF